MGGTTVLSAAGDERQWQVSPGALPLVLGRPLGLLKILVMWKVLRGLVGGAGNQHSVDLEKEFFLAPLQFLLHQQEAGFNFVSTFSGLK